MINLKINGIDVAVDRGTTLLEAAEGYRAREVNGAIGEASQFDLVWAWIRPSKLRFPESTEHTFKSPVSIASAIGSVRGPELPIQVVQP